MGLAEELIAIKMRLQGAAAYQREMQRSAAATTEFGTAAERAGAQARSGAVGMNAMGASANKGVSALTRMKTAGAGMKRVGGQMTSAFTVPIALIGGAGVAMALHFSDSMEQIATQAGASQREVSLMSKKVLEFASSGKSSSGPNELAAGLFRIESAGFRGKRAFDALVKSEQLATVGHANLEKSSTALSAAMATGIKGTDNLNEAVGIMNATVGIGNMRFEDMLSAMGTGLLDRAANFGISFKEVGAALGTMTTVGQPAAASATRIGMALNMMSAPTDKAKKAMKGVGLGALQMAMSLRKRGLVPTLKMLKSHLDATFGTSKRGLSEQTNAISEMFGGGRTSGGLVALLRHVDLLKRKLGELTGVQGKFKRALERTNKQPIVELKQAWAQLQPVLIGVGNALIPLVTKVAKFIVSAAKWIGNLPGPIKKFLLVAAGVLAVAGPLLSTVGFLTIGFAQLGIALGIGSVALLGWIAAAPLILAGWYEIITHFKTWGKYVVAFFIGPVAMAATFVVSHWDAIKGGITDAINAVVGVVKKIPGLLLDALKSYPRVFGWIIGFWITLPYRVGAALVKWAPIVASKGMEVLAFIRSMPGRAVTALVGLAPKMFKLGVEGMTKLWNGLKSVESSIENWFSSMPGKIWNWIKGHAGDILNAGKNLAKEFLGGFTNAIPGPIKDLLGIGGSEEILGEVTVRPGLGGKPRHRGPHGTKYPLELKRRPGPKAGASSVRPLVSRGGPTPTALDTRAQGGAGRGRRGTPVHVHAHFKVGRRQFGEAMAMAMIDDEANS
jgi:TP901 family phage tail tape measure protein